MSCQKIFSLHTAVLENTQSTKLQFAPNSSLIGCQLAKSRAFGVLGFNFEGSRPNRANCVQLIWQGLEWNIINTKGENLIVQQMSYVIRYHQIEGSTSLHTVHTVQTALHCFKSSMRAHQTIHKNLFLEFPKNPGNFMLHFDR